MKQLQQSQMSMKETLEKARNLTDLPTLLSHTAQVHRDVADTLQLYSSYHNMKTCEAH